MSAQIPLWTALIVAVIGLVFGVCLGALTTAALIASSRRPPEKGR